jgi:hypothetical protein
VAVDGVTLPFRYTSAGTNVACAPCDVKLARGEAAAGCGSAEAVERFTESTLAAVRAAAISSAEAAVAGSAFVSGNAEDVAVAA